ncbi:MAG: hypothetical protein MZV70_67160 [Desulfobacterales bacterium]|nr:hypothetical protein [Desulfobacterales bacterium]
MTGAGMMDCKKALQESEGDFELAIGILRKKGRKVKPPSAPTVTFQPGRCRNPPPPPTRPTPRS